MPAPEKKTPNRDITYQVGWKKGTIHVQPPVNPDGGTGENAAVQEEAAQADPAVNRLLRGIWRAAPYPNGKAALLIAAAVPALAFAVLVWLVSRLSQGS